MSKPDSGPLRAFQDEAQGGATNVQRIFDVLLESSDDGVLIFDRELRVVFMNAAAEHLTGQVRDDIFRSPSCCGQILGCMDEYGRELDHASGCPVRCLLRGEYTEPIERELLIKHRKGADVWLRNRYFPVVGASGASEFVICILRDISERRAMEEQLIESRKLATFGVLTAGIAHELKNPLGILRSAAEIIANPERSEGDRLEAAEFVKTETMRLDLIIKQFLAYARPNPPEFAETDLNEVADHTVEIFMARDGRPEGIKIEKRFADSVLRCWLDAAQIHQVLLNLLLNAEQSLGREGLIVISTEAVGDNWVCLHVDDNGDGIDSSQVERIFDPFFTTKSDGSGLGLAVVRRIVTEHYGRIGVDRSELGGASLTVRLPRHPSARPIPVRIDRSVAPIGTGMSMALRSGISEKGKNDAQTEDTDCR